MSQPPPRRYFDNKTSLALGLVARGQPWAHGVPPHGKIEIPGPHIHVIDFRGENPQGDKVEGGWNNWAQPWHPPYLFQGRELKFKISQDDAGVHLNEVKKDNDIKTIVATALQRVGLHQDWEN